MDGHCRPRPSLRLTAASSTLLPQRRQPGERPECKPCLTCVSEAQTGRAPGGSALVPGSRQAAGGQRPPGPGPTRPLENRPTGGPSRGLPGQTRCLTHHPGPPLDKAATNLKAKKKKEKEKMHGEKDRKHRPVQGQRKEQHLLFKIYRKSEHVSTWRYS